MSKKVLITTTPFARQIREDNPVLRPAVKAMRDGGIELVLMEKGEHHYSLDELKRTAAGCTAAIIGSEAWTEEKFKLCPDLKAVCRFGVGFDAVNLEDAKKCGVWATNARVQELSDSVAECALALALMVNRRFGQPFIDLRNGKWVQNAGNQLKGKTVGIVGFGAIGRSFAALLQSFGVTILASDPFMNNELAAKLNAKPVDMDTLLAQSDIVSLSAPNTKENRHMFNAAAFAKMKDRSIFVNTARGAMVDEKALYDALTSGKLAGAGIDVFEKEPTPADNPLLKLNNIVVLPHMAAETFESAIAVAMCCARQVMDVCNGKAPENLLNP